MADLLRMEGAKDVYRGTIVNYARHMMTDKKPKHDIFRVSDIISVAFGIDKDKVFEDILTIKEDLRG